MRGLETCIREKEVGSGDGDNWDLLPVSVKKRQRTTSATPAERSRPVAQVNRIRGLLNWVRRAWMKGGRRESWVRSARLPSLPMPQLRTRGSGFLGFSVGVGVCVGLGGGGGGGGAADDCSVECVRVRGVGGADEDGVGRAD